MSAPLVERVARLAAAIEALPVVAGGPYVWRAPKGDLIQPAGKTEKQIRDGLGVIVVFGDVRAAAARAYSDAATHGVAFPAAAWEAAVESGDPEAMLSVVAQAYADIAWCLAHRDPAGGACEHPQPCYCATSRGWWAIRGLTPPAWAV